MTISEKKALQLEDGLDKDEDIKEIMINARVLTPLNSHDK